MADDIIDVNDLSDRDALDSLDDDKSKENDDKDKSSEEKTDETEEGKESDDEDSEESEENNEEETEESDETDEEVKDDNLYKQLKAYDKELFKKNPELKEILFRERAYTEVFPTVDDAKEALESAQTFRDFQSDLMSGNFSTILEAIEKSDKDAVKDLVADLIPAVEKMSKDLYFDMMAPELKKTFRILARNSNEAIAVSAKNLHYAVFGHHDMTKDEGLVKDSKKDEREDKLTKREREIEEKQYNSFRDDVVNVCTKRAQHYIAIAFKDSGLSPLMQKSLTNEIYKRVGNDLENDKRHMGNMASLFKQAQQKGFTSDWKDRINNAYLSRAKALIPKHRRAVIAESKLSVKVSDDNGKTGKEKIRVTPSSQSVTNPIMGKNIDKSKIDWERTSDRDALDGKFVMKK